MDKKFRSPTIVMEPSEEAYAIAKDSDSGACVWADDIRSKYPRPLGINDVDVNVATTVIRDRVGGFTYTYLTPADVAQSLLAYDQGWRNPTRKATLKRAVKIIPIRGEGMRARGRKNESRTERIAELEAKEAAGDLTPIETRSLKMFRKPRRVVERPATHGPAEVAVVRGQPVVFGGRPIRKPPVANQNLLGGRHRIFGRKLADPGTAFRAAVEEAVKARESE